MVTASKGTDHQSTSSHFDISGIFSCIDSRGLYATRLQHQKYILHHLIVSLLCCVKFGLDIKDSLEV
jgi:hypothetical protein